MPIEYAISLDSDLVHARWWGRVDFDQFRKNFERFLMDANYRPGRPELIDLSGITDFDVNFDKVRAMLRVVNEQVPDQKVQTRTVIWSPNDTIFGMGRMYQQLAELAGGITVEVYRDEREALAAYDFPDRTIADLLERLTFLPAVVTSPA